MLIIVGGLVVLSPFSGVPLSWLTWFFLFAGALVVGIGVSLRYERLRRARKATSAHEAHHTQVVS